MSEDDIVVVNTVEVLPLRHQFGKMALGTVAAFVATKLADKAYIMALTAYRQKFATPS
jgi:hypothetical protein